MVDLTITKACVLVGSKLASRRNLYYTIRRCDCDPTSYSITPNSSHTKPGVGKFGCHSSHICLKIKTAEGNIVSENNNKKMPEM